MVRETRDGAHLMALSVLENATYWLSRYTKHGTRIVATSSQCSTLLAAARSVGIWYRSCTKSSTDT